MRKGTKRESWADSVKQEDRPDRQTLAQKCPLDGGDRPACTSVGLLRWLRFRMACVRKRARGRRVKMEVPQTNAQGRECHEGRVPDALMDALHRPSGNPSPAPYGAFRKNALNAIAKGLVC